MYIFTALKLMYIEFLNFVFVQHKIVLYFKEEKQIIQILSRKKFSITFQTFITKKLASDFAISKIRIKTKDSYIFDAMNLLMGFIFQIYVSFNLLKIVNKTPK